MLTGQRPSTALSSSARVTACLLKYPPYSSDCCLLGDTANHLTKAMCDELVSLHDASSDNEQMSQSDKCKTSKKNK